MISDTNRTDVWWGVHGAESRLEKGAERGFKEYVKVMLMSVQAELKQRNNDDGDRGEVMAEAGGLRTEMALREWGYQCQNSIS